MKIIKKIAAIMLSVMMVLGMCSVVGAEEASGSYEDDNGKITIQNAKKNQTYTIYRILKLESFSRGDKREEGNYAYTLEEGWDDFLTNSSEYPTGNCLKKDNNTGYVTWDSTKTDYAAFAKDALKYVKAKPIAPAKDAVTPSEDGAVSFEKLPLGYYLIDSTAGALCSLDTTDKEVIIQEKNGVPSVEKKVQEDSTSKWESSNTADIGQIVNFKTTITAQAGAQSYVLHDKMDKGLTFNGDVTVKINKSGTTGETSVDSQNYEVKTEGFSSGDTCTFHVEFKQTFCDNLANGDQIIIYYSAKLNDEATIKTDKNKNETWLGYGDNKFTIHKTTTTYTYEIPVFKYTIETAMTKKPLAKATFKLSKKSDGSETIKIKQKTDENNVYLVDPNATTTEITTDSTGEFTIQGLDADIYYLTEIQQPAGYNKLSAPVKIVINESGTITIGESADPVDKVEVENKSGSILPSTGGMGTTLFYIFGAILVIGSGVVLITKKRMK